MKKLLLILPLVFFSLFSCGDDDDDETVNNSIVGTWKMISSTANGVSNFNPNDCDDQFTVIFNSNATFVEKYYTNNSSGTSCIEEDTDVGSYSFENNILILNYTDDDPDTINASLSNNGNTLTVTSTDIFNGIQYNYVAVLQRQ